MFILKMNKLFLIGGVIILVVSGGLVELRSIQIRAKNPVPSFSSINEPTPPFSSETPSQLSTPEESKTVRDMCKNGEWVSCNSLAESWITGTAICRTNRTGFNISSCSQKKSDMAEMVKPAERDSKLWKTARCNDGSPFGFDVKLSKSNSKAWIVYLEGGAFCEDNAKSCSERGEKLSSSPKEPDRTATQIKPEGIFNPSKSVNPEFYDANWAFGRYCSSDGWSGGTTNRRETVADPNGWYFSGRINVASMVEILKQRFGLDDADPQTHVLLAGSSAGGIGVEVNGDNLANLLPKKAQAGRLKLINDGGFIPDFDDPDYRPGDSDDPLRTIVSMGYDFWGSKLNPLCEKEHIQNPGACFLSAVVYPYITDKSPKGLGLPLMIQYSSIDKFAIELHGIKDKNKDSAGLENYRQTSLRELGGIKWVFSGGSFPYHTILTSPEGWTMGPSGKTFREVLARFWTGRKEEQVIFGNP